MSKRKALGQHFLRHPKALKSILKIISPGPQDLILEIGAGKGALTFPLAQKAKQVIAVEKDEKLLSFLNQRHLPNLKIIAGDILFLDWRQLLEPYLPWEGEIKLVGNLPYSISTPLLFKVLEHRDLFPYIVFLLQREVAARISGRPGSRDYAPLSILFQIYYETTIEKIFPPSYFSPPPKVESALIVLRRRSQPLLEIDRWSEFKNFLKTCFRHRRKQLFKNLKLIGFEESHLNRIFSEFNLRITTRPEELDEITYFRLFKQLHEKVAEPK